MARSGISYEQVAAVADAMIGEGTVPTIRAVREQLGGTGSPNTIHRHLTVWREAHPVPPAAAPEPSPALSRAFADEIERHAAAERSLLTGLLAQAKVEADELAAAGEALEVKRDELAAQVATLTHELDMKTGVIAQQTTELAAAQAQITLEQAAAESARLEAATGRYELKQQALRVTEQLAEIQRLRDALTAAETGRIAAEQAAAVLTARLEASADALKRAEGREAEAARQAAAAAQALEAARTAAAQEVREAQQEVREAQVASEKAAQGASEAQKRSIRLEGELALAAARAEDAARQAAAAEQTAREALAAREAAREEATAARERAARLEGQVAV
ncbi:MAG: DNA-binding protein, partial [Clostridia bacterium]|nr:DNA-binding protein [Clostridia bacterium]